MMKHHTTKQGRILSLDSAKQKRAEAQWKKATQQNQPCKTSTDLSVNGIYNYVTSGKTHHKEEPRAVYFSEGQANLLRRFFETGYNHKIFYSCAIEQNNEEVSFNVWGQHNRTPLCLSFTKAKAKETTKIRPTPPFQYTASINGQEICKERDSIPALTALKIQVSSLYPS